MTTSFEEKEHYLGPTGLYIAEYPAASNHAVILVPPLFEEHPRTRKLLVNTARRLAAHGISAIRFDYAGTGLSRGSELALSPRSTISDLDVVSKYVRSVYSSNQLLIGFRFGAHVAVEYRHSSNQDIPCLLWEPIIDLEIYLDNLLRIALTNQLVTLGEVKENRKALVAKLESGGDVLVDGYPVTAKFFDQCGSMKQGRFLQMLRADNTEAVFWKTKRAYEFFQEQQIPSNFITGLMTSWDNIRFIDNQPEELLAATLAWCKKHEA